MHRVLHILPAFDIGGAERALARLVAGGLAGAFENHIVSLRGDGPMHAQFIAAGAVVHLLGKSGNASLPFELAALGRRIRPGVVQGWMYHANLAATVLAPVLGPAATLWNIRQSLDDLSGDKFLTRQMIRAGARLSGLPARIVYNSARSARQHEAFGYRPDHTLVIPNGFETGSVTPDPRMGEEYRRRYGIGQQAPLFVHAARYHPMKDHALFVAAGNRVLDTIPDAQFVMMGRGVDAEADELLAQVPHGRRGHFRMLGEQGDVVPFLQAADALVVSSRRAEGFPNVIGEAMMAATPVIATDTGDCADIVGAGGDIVPVRDAAALAAVMASYARDRDLAARKGRDGRARVETVFTIERAAASYAALYRSFLSGV